MSRFATTVVTVPRIVLLAGTLDIITDDGAVQFYPEVEKEDSHTPRDNTRPHGEEEGVFVAV